jgi:hypothetical protein
MKWCSDFSAEIIGPGGITFGKIKNWTSEGEIMFLWLIQYCLVSCGNGENQFTETTYNVAAI